ncbi:MAG: hypothetical protein IMZ44_02140 [Planctomycetes bacterium]|nr:hypothetical protein [Planctomycetota bacterium]
MRVQRYIASVVAVLCVVLGVAAPARSQSQPLPRANQKAIEQAQARYQFSVMEAVMEKAVENAARLMNRQVQPMTPNLLMFGSAARARGFRLDGYGVFFDVEVPTMERQSLAWSFQIIGPPDSALKSLRDHVRSLTNAQERDQLDRALRQIEIQFPARRVSGSGQDNDPKAPQVQPIDPNEAYTNAVTTALMDAMLDYSGPLQIGPDEWLAVAARGYEGQRGLDPDAPYDLVTIVMRIKGGDLSAFRANRLTRDEARKRIEVKEF